MRSERAREGRGGKWIPMRLSGQYFLVSVLKSVTRRRSPQPPPNSSRDSINHKRENIQTADTVTKMRTIIMMFSTSFASVLFPRGVPFAGHDTTALSSSFVERPCINKTRDIVAGKLFE